MGRGRGTRCPAGAWHRPHGHGQRHPLRHVGAWVGHRHGHTGMGMGRGAPAWAPHQHQHGMGTSQTPQTRPCAGFGFCVTRYEKGDDVPLRRAGAGAAPHFQGMEPRGVWCRVTYSNAGDARGWPAQDWALSPAFEQTGKACLSSGWCAAQHPEPRRCCVMRWHHCAHSDVPRTSGPGIAVASCGRAGVTSVTWLVTLATHGDTGQTVGASCTCILHPVAMAGAGVGKKA